MPCYEVRLVSVEFHAEHRDLLDKAIKALDMKVWEQTSARICFTNGITLDLADGRAQVPEGLQGELNKLKQQYSREAVKQKTAKFGWNFQWNNQAKTKGTLAKTYL